MNEPWTNKELQAAVAAYIEMAQKEHDGIPYVKTHYYDQLALRFNRTAKSFEYRMQNISYVYSLLGRNWLPGLKPAKNVGLHNVALIEQFIAEEEHLDVLPVAVFETEVLKYQTKTHLERPEGIKEPERSYSAITVYRRDPKVKAWVLNAAHGYCECCGAIAPFSTDIGTPFLEVHHLRPLANGGSDTISNAVALCPNCHREIHYGLHKMERVRLLYQQVSRLVRE